MRKRVLGRFLRHNLALIGLFIVGSVIVAAVLAPVIAPYDYRHIDAPSRLSAPSSQYLLGTDNLGRDLLTRIIFGARISLLIAFGATFMAVLIGIGIGGASGALGGWTETVLMRFTDIILCIPRFFLVLVISAVVGPSTFNTFLILGVTGWPTAARIVRGEILALKESDYVTAAHAMGCSQARVLFKHLLPNVIPSLIVFATLFAANMIIYEATLSFLGLGAQPPYPSWGNMLSAGRDSIYLAWWMSTFPGIAIFMTVLGLNFLGDGLRDALDPKTSE